MIPTTFYSLISYDNRTRIPDTNSKNTAHIVSCRVLYIRDLSFLVPHINPKQDPTWGCCFCVWGLLSGAFCCFLLFMAFNQIQLNNLLHCHQKTTFTRCKSGSKLLSGEHVLLIAKFSELSSEFFLLLISSCIRRYLNSSSVIAKSCGSAE